MNSKTKPQPQESEFSQPNRQRQAQQTIKCFVVPLEAMEQIRDCVREAPHKTAQPVLAALATLQVMDVPVGPPPES